MNIFKTFKRIISILAVIVLLSSSYKIASYFYHSESNKKIYKDLSREYESIEKTDDIKEESLKSINKNIVGWLKLPNTKINYPLVQGDDNLFYLNHDINNKYSIHGSIFMDYRNKNSDDKNLIIYGHHMKDGTMFKDLVKYKEAEFFKENNLVYLDIDGKILEYEIFSVIVTQGDSDYISIDFNDSDEFLNYIEDVRRNSLFNRDIDFNGDEEILTLSTCSYEFDNARTAIYAVKK